MTTLTKEELAAEEWINDVYADEFVRDSISFIRTKKGFLAGVKWAHQNPKQKCCESAGGINKEKILVKISGCDDSTLFEIDMSPKEKEFFELLSKLSNETSTYCCMPTIEIADCYDKEEFFEKKESAIKESLIAGKEEHETKT